MPLTKKDHLKAAEKRKASIEDLDNQNHKKVKIDAGESETIGDNQPSFSESKADDAVTKPDAVVTAILVQTQTNSIDITDDGDNSGKAYTQQTK